MILLWLVAGASLVVSLVAIRGLRRVARRQEELSQLYWELRYQQGELRAQLHADEPRPGAVAAPPPAAEAFVPLSAVKR